MQTCFFSDCLCTKQSFKISNNFSWIRSRCICRRALDFEFKGEQHHKGKLCRIFTNKWDQHPVPKFNHLFLNVVIFGGNNALTTFQTECKTIFAQYRDNGLNLPNFKTETSLVDIWIIFMSFLWRGQTRTIRALFSLCSLFLSSQSDCMQFDSIRNCIATWKPPINFLGSEAVETITYSRLQLQGWRNNARDNYVESFSIVT